MGCQVWMERRANQMEGYQVWAEASVYWLGDICAEVNQAVIKLRTLAAARVRCNGILYQLLRKTL